MKRISLLLLLLTFIFGCKDLLPDAKEFPIIRTNSPKDIDETGATFQGEIIVSGKLPVTSHGFVWGVIDPKVEISEKIILDGYPTSSTFSIRINHGLAKGVKYTIRSFATCGDMSVYGDPVNFISKSSTQNGWTMVNRVVNVGVPVYSCADYENGYAIYPDSKAGRFSTSTNSFTSISDFPYQVNNDRFTSVVSNQIPYMIMNGRKIIKFLNDTWYIVAIPPFEYSEFSGYYQGLAVNNKIYSLSSHESFMYDLDSGTWERKARLPTEGGYSNGGTTLNGKAYVITSDNYLWEYEPTTDKWSLKTQYPGTLGDRIAAFSYHNKLYFGLSSISQEGNRLVDNRLWSYDPSTNIWITMEKFPTDHNFGTLFYFFVKANLYVWMENTGIASTSTLWNYDPSKNE